MMTWSKRYGLLTGKDYLEIVEMPTSHMYQLTALFVRLHKELGKLTADNIPALPVIAAEFDHLELLDPTLTVTTGLSYINRLEQQFASVHETAYPLIALLTEIRALQAQLEQCYEEEAEV